jgi:hypothetical protein
VRVVWYNIQDPADPQVNGFGFYRTAVDGVIPLLVVKKHIGGKSTQFPDVEFAITQPWEAADCSNESLVPVFTIPSQFTFTENLSATLTVGNAVNSNVKTTVDATGPAGNAYTMIVEAAPGDNDAASASILVNVITVLLGKTSAALDPVKNTGTIIQGLIDALANVSAVLLGTGAASWVQLQIDRSPYTFSGGTDGTQEQKCTATQVWEIDPPIHRSSEDTYRVCQPWELVFLRDYLASNVFQSRITWAFSSTMEDDELGAEVEYDNDLPVGNHLVASFQEQLFLAGDPDNPNWLYFSKRFHPEAVPTDNYIEIGTANDPITALVVIAGLMGMFTRDTKYRVSGNTTTGFTHHEAISRRGTRATKSVVPSDKGIIFVANDGVYTTNLIGPDTQISAKIDSLFTGDTVSGEEPINQDAMDQVAGVYYKNKYYFVYPAGDATIPNRMAVYGFDSAEDWAIYDLGGGSMLYESDTDALVLGGDDGFVYIMESGVTDDGAAISSEIVTKDFQGSSYNTNNLFLYLKIDCEVANGVVLVVEFYVDDVLRHTLSIPTTSVRVNNLSPLPEGTFGTRWRVRMTLSDDHGGTKFYGVAAVFIPLASS